MAFLHRFASVCGRVSSSSVVFRTRVFSTMPPISDLRKLQVAIVGRPNTGKSTLFNRFTKSGNAIVSDVPGTTRDRKEGMGWLAGVPFHVVDTGGFDNRGIVSSDIHGQVDSALSQADIILFMVDAKDGINSLDQNFARWIRRRIGIYDEEARALSDGQYVPKSVLVLANKTEGSFLSDKVLNSFADALQFGLGEPVPISASHGDGMGDLAAFFIDQARLRKCDDGGEAEVKKREGPIPIEERTINVALMGRPNVGKSAILNAVLGEDRVISGPTPGLTRDSISVQWEYEDRRFVLVDTAGLTKTIVDPELAKKSVKEKKMFDLHNRTGKGLDAKLPGTNLLDPEEDPSQFSYQVAELSIASALKALNYAQVVVIVVEGDQGRFSKVDLQLLRKCQEEGRSVVIAANKRDQMALLGITGKEYEEGVRKQAENLVKNFGNLQVVSCSATEQEGLYRLLDTIIATHDAWSKRVSTWVLNRWMRDVIIGSPVPRVGNKSVSVKFITQIKSRPPTFALFANCEELPEFFEKFLRTRLQHDFRLDGVPIRFVLRRSQGKSAETSLLRHGKKSRRGVGNGADRGVGPRNRDNQYAKLKKRQTRLDARKQRKRLMKKQK